jgi:hypothetical protein
MSAVSTPLSLRAAICTLHADKLSLILSAFCSADFRQRVESSE